MTTKVRYFFVGGTPKSGTTWVQRQLDAHPAMTCSGEGHFHEYLVKPIFSMFIEYNKKLDTVGQAVYEGRTYYQPVSRPEIIALTRRYIIDRMSMRSKKSNLAIGDKTPSYAKIIDDLLVLFPEMSFIFVVRDPRDSTASRLHHAARVAGPAALDAKGGFYREIVEAGITDWIEALDGVVRFSARHPRKVLTVRYEDALEDAGRTISGMFSFLNVPASPNIVSDVMQETSFERLSGRKPGIEDRASFLRKGIRGDWVNVLDGQAAARVLERCGAGMRKLGYIE